jgi:hypothetical protein
MQDAAAFAEGVLGVVVARVAPSCLEVIDERPGWSAEPGLGTSGLSAAASERSNAKRLRHVSPTCWLCGTRQSRDGDPVCGVRLLDTQQVRHECDESIPDDAHSGLAGLADTRASCSPMHGAHRAYPRASGRHGLGLRTPPSR